MTPCYCFLDIFVCFATRGTILLFIVLNQALFQSNLPELSIPKQMSGVAVDDLIGVNVSVSVRYHYHCLWRS